MGSRGPLPLPTAVLKMRGSWLAKSRVKQGEPMPEVATPEKTPRVAANPDASELWDEVVPQMEAMGILTRYDRRAVEALCMTYAMAYSESDPDRALKYMEATRRWFEHFGMTPASRARLRKEPKANGIVGGNNDKARFFSQPNVG